MNFNHIPYSKIDNNNLDTSAFNSNPDLIEELIGLPFCIDNFKKQIKNKQKHYASNNRKVISDVLIHNYQGIDTSSLLDKNLSDLANPNTYTVTTGHQLNLFAGPAYFVYKILHVISMCNQLRISYPDYNFVPVFWMASEDHDIEEIRRTNIFGKELLWETNQTGCVGAFDCKGIPELLKEFKGYYENASSSDISEILDSYSGSSLSIATFHLLNKLFGDKGLLILDANNNKLKELAKHLFIQEINEMFIQKNVNETNIILKSKNIKTQAFVREINLFFIDHNNKRERIKIGNNDFIIGDKKFSKNKLIEMIDSNPESFSPNVLFRPLYQEYILPNLCYLGGGAEIRYWLQLKNAFNTAKIPFPLLARRKTVFYINKANLQRINSLSLTKEDLFKNEMEIMDQYLSVNNHKLNWNKTDDYFMEFTKNTSVNYKHLNKSIISSLNADLQKIKNAKDVLKKRIDKENKRQFEQIKIIINKLHLSLFPNQKYQERQVHFFQFCPDGKLELMNELLEKFEPFNNSVLLVSE